MRKRKIYTLGGKELKKFFKENLDIATGLAGNYAESAYYFQNGGMVCTDIIDAEFLGYKYVTTLEFIDYLKQVMKAKEAKKSAGRPRKPVPANAVIMKSQTEIALEHANIKIQALQDDVTNLEDRLNQSYLEQEKLFKELEKCIYNTIHHCSEVECNAGKLTMHDIDYCVDLIKRILKNKFEYKPQMD